MLLVLQTFQRRTHTEKAAVLSQQREQGQLVTAPLLPAQLLQTLRAEAMTSAAAAMTAGAGPADDGFAPDDDDAFPSGGNGFEPPPQAGGSVLVFIEESAVALVSSLTFSVAATVKEAFQVGGSAGALADAPASLGDEKAEPAAPRAPPLPLSLLLL